MPQFTGTKWATAAPQYTGAKWQNAPPQYTGAKWLNRPPQYTGAKWLTTPPGSNMPAGATQAPKGDLGKFRQMESDKLGGFKQGKTIKASSYFKGAGDLMKKM